MEGGRSKGDSMSLDCCSGQCELCVNVNTGVEYLAFLSQQGKMVSSEPSNLRKKLVPGEMIFSPW
jgi:hypothetical protein